MDRLDRLKRHWVVLIRLFESRLFSFTSFFGVLYASAAVVCGVCLLFWGLYDPDARNPLVWGFGALMAWYGLYQWKGMLGWWRAVPSARLTLSETGFALPNGHFRYEDVEHVGLVYAVTRKRYNFMDAGEDHNVLATLVLGGGQRMEIVGGQGPTSWFGPTLGKDSAASLLQKVQEIQKRTLGARASKLMSALETQRYFFYDSKRIDADGSVHFPDAKVPLTRFWLDSKSPFELLSRTKNGQFHKSGKIRSLSLAEDRDAFLVVAAQAFNLSWPSAGGWAQGNAKRSG